MTTLTRPHPRGRRAAGLLAAVTMTGALVAGLAACSSSSDSSSDTGGSDGGSVSSEVAPSPSERQLADQSESAGDTAADSGKVADTGSPAARPAAIDRAVISTGTVSLVSDDVADARREVQRIVDGQRGTISQEDTETDDEGVATYSRLVIRVPSGSFTETMQALEKAAELRQSQVTSEDVTTQVIDTDVRVRAQEGSLRRVEQLLARAESLKDIIWIESQLTTRQAELDSLKSQQAWLSDQTSESTITIDIARTPEVEEKAEEDRDDAGFLAGLTSGMDALGGFAVALATIVGALLPFAIVLAVFGLPTWLLVRRSARRRTPKQPATP
ncbi:DUF4349 domain-containing protein [Nocardioides currus]|uniref:DUF4349 domain-containing protein n=1 Tax=Nocardioides currus TaxID=2133958 RepID=A0A2R7Z1E6_9ACTN|nr:DUF4349 domain-containing protein [Nocardioides currus]PUA82384.1 hypothetical protein C7S10_01145 [Nocardioides currus]